MSVIRFVVGLQLPLSLFLLPVIVGKTLSLHNLISTQFVLAVSRPHLQAYAVTGATGPAPSVLVPLFIHVQLCRQGEAHVAFATKSCAQPTRRCQRWDVGVNLKRRSCRIDPTSLNSIPYRTQFGNKRVLEQVQTPYLQCQYFFCRFSNAGLHEAAPASPVLSTQNAIQNFDLVLFDFSKSIKQKERNCQAKQIQSRESPLKVLILWQQGKGGI